MADFGVIAADVLADVAAGGRAQRISFTAEAARALVSYGWPLNIRELHQAMASAVALAVDDVIDEQQLPGELQVAPEQPAPTQVPARAPPADDALRDRIVSLLHEHGGNVAAVARALGKAPAQIHRWMQRKTCSPGTSPAQLPGQGRRDAFRGDTSQPLSHSNRSFSLRSRKAADGRGSAR